MLKRLDHVGIVVRNLKQTQQIYVDALRMKDSKYEQLQTAEALFLPIGDTSLELLEPNGTDGHLYQFLASKGEGVHHICFEVDDIDTIVQQLISQGIKMRDKVARTGTRGSKIAFTEPDQFGGVLIEFCQFTKKI